MNKRMAVVLVLLVVVFMPTFAFAQEDPCEGEVDSYWNGSEIVPCEVEPDKTPFHLEPANGAGGGAIPLGEPTVEVLSTPVPVTATEEAAAPVEIEIERVLVFEDVQFSYDEWRLKQLSEEGRNALYTIGDETWELPLETHMASDMSGERIEAVDPVDSNPDAGYCNERTTGQRDCTNHTLLYRVLVPVEFEECMSLAMDIAHRIQLVNDCDQDVPVQISLRWNLASVTGDAEQWGLTTSGLQTTHADLAGGDPSLMFSTGLAVEGESGGYLQASLGEAIPVGYSCWDCKSGSSSDTSGPDAEAIPLDGETVQSSGQGSAPLGETELVGLSVPIPDPATNPDFRLDGMFIIPAAGEMGATEAYAWIGQYNPEIDRLTAEMRAGQGGALSQESIGSLVVQVQRLNVRSEASEAAPILEPTHFGENWQVFESQPGWYRIPAGWVSAEFVEFTPNE